MIQVPSLILDVAKCKKNIQEMALKAKKHDLTFRPHFKTHQSLEIGRWFKAYGVQQITVSSLEMADYFAEEWNDITVAFPTNILEIDRINALAKRVHLNVLVESVDTAKYLSENLRNTVGFFIKIDAGYHRTGLEPNKTTIINEILKISSAAQKLDFKGFLAHSGHTYKCNQHEDILEIHETCVRVLNNLKKIYSVDFPDLIVSLGDTPSCSIADHFSGIDEIRPGNFVFYDLMQHRIGSNAVDQISVAMACPIVAIHEDRNELVIYGGGVHFSKERLDTKNEEGVIYGGIVEKKGNVWGDLIPGTYIKSLSQEHGIVAVPSTHIKKYTIGDYLLIVPIHSCMTANLMKRFKTTEGEEIVMMNSW
ncbi:alanine racemase [Aquimarina sp. U1-2]|uniref:alanine racemase n=1 Tax=Aquimarina sp. U1-2 TaxID=2823141 RepID=UPI001AECBDD4|nr:alanine racemase [Aquimarina sp. U1-2]MBP2832766.1 alanine racemase [Aquimarina sp. U1-2]